LPTHRELVQALFAYDVVGFQAPSDLRAFRDYITVEAGGRVFRTLEIPTTLPTLDETLAWPQPKTDADQRALFRKEARGTQVHTIHAEIEGRSRATLFEGILDDWLADGVSFPLLSELAREVLQHHDAIPVRPISKATLPGRTGTVTTGWPEAALL
jgi:hypothetical protein